MPHDPYGIAAITRERDQLRAALRELVEALPRCSFDGYGNDEPECGKPSTHSYPNEPVYYCAEHARDRHCKEAWADPATRALALLEAGKPGRLT